MALNKDHIISTLTNLAYGYAGWMIYMLDHSAIIPALACIVLMAGSGYHHWHLESWSRKYDYIAMYMVICSLVAFGVGLSIGLQAGIAFGMGLILYFLFNSNEYVIVGGMFACLVLVHLIASYGSALVVASVMAIAFIFNFIGDEVHKDKHDLVHGIGWHIPTATAIFLTVKFLL